MSGWKYHILNRKMEKKADWAYQRKSLVVRHCKRVLADRAGFSLVELIAVIVILSMLAAIVVPRYIDLDANARQRAIDAGISELNGREGLAWSNIKLSPTGWQDDTTTFDSYDKDLGEDYIWMVGPNATGGQIKFRPTGDPVSITRTESTTSQPGYWSK